MAIKVGEMAPVFSLYDTEKHIVHLQDFNEHKIVLLLFFPLAFTSTCTKELCDVRDDLSRYDDDDVQVIGISVDSVYTLAKYKEAQRYNFPLLSDFNRDVSNLYETLYTSFGKMEMQGVSKRSAFLIDKKGVIRYAEVLENASQIPDFHAIKQAIKLL